jgi:hypothetical protein
MPVRWRRIVRASLTNGCGRDPRVVAGRHVEGLARAELALGAVVHTKRHPAFEDVADVLNLARVGPGDRIDVL